MSPLISLGVCFIKLYLIPLYLFTINKKFDTDNRLIPQAWMLIEQNKTEKKNHTYSTH